jgi:hypothetical protein
MFKKASVFVLGKSFQLVLMFAGNDESLPLLANIKPVWVCLAGDKHSSFFFPKLQ